MKTDRQSAILDIISEETIGTQQQLQKALARRGIRCTQATLSRDIKELHLRKSHAKNGTLQYAMDTPAGELEKMRKLSKIFKRGIVSFDAAENLIVIKTLPGLASGICTYIDKLKLEHLVGSLAGNDTVLLVMTDGAAVQDWIRVIQTELIHIDHQ